MEDQHAADDILSGGSESREVVVKLDDFISLLGFKFKPGVVGYNTLRRIVVVVRLTTSI
jgi:hypothetical protein